MSDGTKSAAGPQFLLTYPHTLQLIRVYVGDLILGVPASIVSAGKHCVGNLGSLAIHNRWPVDKVALCEARVWLRCC